MPTVYILLLLAIVGLAGYVLYPLWQESRDRKRRSELERELAAYSTSALLGSWTYSAFSAPDHDLKLGTGRS